MEAMEAIKILAGIGDTLKNTLLVCDFYDMYMAKVDIFKNPKCPVCGEAKPEKGMEVTEQLVWLCGQNTVNVNPRKPLRLSINDVCNRLSKRFEVLLRSSFVVVFEHNDAEVSLFKGGRALIKNVKSEKDALEIYKSVLKHLEAETN